MLMGLVNIFMGLKKNMAQRMIHVKEHIPRIHCTGVREPLGYFVVNVHRKRLDQILVDRGFFGSRERAKRAVMAGGGGGG
ncbi:MAG TPA: TlyA family rRNA (cytidine-2'-O)-methyltransferase, partial [Verrucomicrobiales bacterium]|nr:TlyA family rRNA (cytidine-2'-O)-methyltransferase [Verrucomicrobiales bacterium]